MLNSKTKELLQKYKTIKDRISEIELFSTASTSENPYVVKLQQELESELNAFRDIYYDYSSITADYGGIDKKYLRSKIAFMTFLITYLPDVFADMEQPVYGGSMHRVKYSRKVKVSKRSTRKKRKTTRKNKKMSRKCKLL